MTSFLFVMQLALAKPGLKRLGKRLFSASAALSLVAAVYAETIQQVQNCTLHLNWHYEDL